MVAIGECAASETPATNDADLQGKRVLIVEDEGMIAVLFETVLSDLGMAVAGIARSAADAIDLIEQAGGPIDVALLDVNLGGEPVYPVADALHSRDIGFVFLTGYDSGSLPSRFADDVVLRKPVAMPDLVEALRKCLSASPAGA